MTTRANGAVNLANRAYQLQRAEQTCVNRLRAVAGLKDAMGFPDCYAKNISLEQLDAKIAIFEEELDASQFFIYAHLKERGVRLIWEWVSLQGAKAIWVRKARDVRKGTLAGDTHKKRAAPKHEIFRTAFRAWRAENPEAPKAEFIKQWTGPPCYSARQAYDILSAET